MLHSKTIVFFIFVFVFAKPLFASNLKNLLEVYRVGSSEQRVQDLKFKENESQRLIYRSKFWPEVSATAESGVLRNRAALVMQQMVYDGGLTSARVEMVKAKKNVDASELEVAKQQKRIELINAYVDYVTFRELRKYYEETMLPRYASFESFFKKSFKFQTVAKSEPILAELEHANARNYHLDLKKEEQLAINKILQVLNLKPSELKPDTLQSNLLEPTNKKELSFEFVFNQAIKNHPAYKSYAWKDKMIQEQLDAELAEHRPKLYLFARPNYDSSRVEDDRFEVQAGVALTVPLFAGFASKHKKEKYAALQAINKVEAQRFRSEFVEQVQNLVFVIDATKNKIKLTDEHIPTALNSWSVISREFRAGAVSSSSTVSRTLEQLAQMQIERLRQVSLYTKSLLMLEELLREE